MTKRENKEEEEKTEYQLHQIMIVILLLTILFSSSHSDLICLNCVDDWWIADECLLSVAVNAYGEDYDNEFVETIHSEICWIENIYWITDMSYDSSILEGESQSLFIILPPFISWVLIKERTML